LAPIHHDERDRDHDADDRRQRRLESVDVWLERGSAGDVSGQRGERDPDEHGGGERPE
jgi:hypothetical protein